MVSKGTLNRFEPQQTITNLRSTIHPVRKKHGAGWSVQKQKCTTRAQSPWVSSKSKTWGRSGGWTKGNLRQNRRNLGLTYVIIDQTCTAPHNSNRILYVQLCWDQDGSWPLCSMLRWTWLSSEPCPPLPLAFPPAIMDSCKGYGCR
jgi:hypothetical protein